MPSLTRFRVSLLVLSVFLIGCQSEEMGMQSIGGVWTVAAIETGTGINRDPEPSQAIFSGDHYSLLWISGDSSMRAFSERWVPTESEMVRRYGEIVVNAGNFEVQDDSTLVLRPEVSRVPEFMGGGRLIYRFRHARDTLWLASIDEYSFDGVQAPWAAAGNRVTLVLVRAEESVGEN